MNKGHLGPFPVGRLATPVEFDEPLEFIRAEHQRQLSVCDWVGEFTGSLGSDPVPEDATALLNFLMRDLPLHMEDEEQDLFPLLKLRCLPEDGINAILQQLSREHALDGDLVDFIVSDLRLIAGKAKVPNLVRFFVNIHGFTEAQRRHLAWENDVVLPIARERLIAEDLAELGRNMASRRGIAVSG